jgi:hypothetical protein
VGQTEEQMTESTIVALANLATATAAGHGIVSTLTEANAHLAKQLEDNSNELRELKALLKKGKNWEKRAKKFQPFTKKILLESQLQSFQHSHQHELQLFQAGPQAGSH